MTTPNKEVQLDRTARRRPRRLVAALTAIAAMAFTFVASPAVAAPIPTPYDQT